MSTLATRRGSSALDLAEKAHALVENRPGQALTMANRALSLARAGRDVDAQVAALHAAAYAELRLGNPGAAAAAIRTGIRLADRHGNTRGAAMLRRLLAASLALSGRTRAALREIDAAAAQLAGLERARSQVHRVAMRRTARAADPATERAVLNDAARGLQTLRRAGDELWEARLLNNRGQLYLERGQLDRAEADWRRAHAIRVRLGAETAAADSALALAEIALLRGDIVGCLKTIEDVRGILPAGPLSNVGRLRVLALTQARLLPEARAAGEEYVALCGRTGRADYVATGLLDLAVIAVLGNEPVAAREFAARAVRSFASHGKVVNAALARTANLRARLLEGSVARSSVRSGLEAAAVLERSGWRREALRARLVVSRAAHEVGARRIAQRQFDLARPLRARGTAVDRIELCHTQALLSLANGQPAAAERLLGRGMHLLDDYRAALGAVELRAAASGIGAELSQLGLRLALDSRRPAKILDWAERLRATTLRIPPVRPPADAKLRALQTELRRTTEQPSKRGAGRQVRLEDAIRARARLLEADGGGAAPPPDVRDAVRALGDRALVEYFELGGELHALTMAGGELVLHELDASHSSEALAWLRFALGRLSRARMDAPRRAATRRNAEASAAELDAALVEPLLPALGERPLVLVPTGALHALPWAALPSLRKRELAVAPSLAMWTAATDHRASRRRKIALVCGPRLRYAGAEIRDLAALLPHAKALSGKDATAKATLAALDGAALAHLACHGHFRADSPLFSSLELADGLLNVYELQRLRHAPEVVVLSACDLALSGLQPGDELLGLASALIGMGTRTIVASVVPVPDAAARRLMIAFHQNLLAGLAPAAALARAQAGSRTPGFICLGLG